jgi:hypothetical protein
VRVKLREGEVSEHEPQLRAELPLQLLYDRVRLAAERTLVVAVFNECHRCVDRTDAVIVLVHRKPQHALLAHTTSAVRAARIASSA